MHPQSFVAPIGQKQTLGRLFQAAQASYVLFMQAFLERFLGAALAGQAMQFLRFGTVGGAGFVVDTAVVYALRGAIGIYAAGAAAYIVAASFTWFFNRLWTFSSATHTAPARQWMVFLTTQSVGFVVNRGVFALLVTMSTLCAEYPVAAIAAGVAAGMFINFAAARRYVFAGN